MATDDMRFKVLRTLVNASEPLTLSAISKKLKTQPQNVIYHLAALEMEGLVIKDNFDYFCQPLLIDEELHELCDEKLSEIVDAFSEKNGSVVVVNDLDADTVILNTLRALITLVLPDGSTAFAR